MYIDGLGTFSCLCKPQGLGLQHIQGLRTVKKRIKKHSIHEFINVFEETFFISYLYSVSIYCKKMIVLFYSIFW